MKKIGLAISAAALLAAPASAPAKAKFTPQQQLDKMLEGRVAGKPVSCISLTTSREARIIDKTAIVYDTGSVIYVNKTTDPKSLDSDDIMVTRITGSELCRLDTVQMHERSMGTWHGFVGLEDFVPWHKAPKAG